MNQQSYGQRTGPDGVGMCAGVLYDEQGAVGRIAQTLQIRARS